MWITHSTSLCGTLKKEKNMQGYNCGPGSANAVLGGSQFVELSPIRCLTDPYPAHLGWGFTPPHRERVFVDHGFYTPPVSLYRDPVFPKPELMIHHYEPKPMVLPDLGYTPSWERPSRPLRSWEQMDPELAMPFIEVFAKKGLLR